MQASKGIIKWFRQKDFDTPKRHGIAPSVVRNRIRRRLGPWYYELASSCGARSHPKREMPGDGPGFVSVRLWYGIDTEREPDFSRKWQADSWQEAKDELKALVALFKAKPVEKEELASPVFDWGSLVFTAG